MKQCLSVPPFFTVEITINFYNNYYVEDSTCSYLYGQHAHIFVGLAATMWTL